MSSRPRFALLRARLMLRPLYMACTEELQQQAHKVTFVSLVDNRKMIKKNRPLSMYISVREFGLCASGRAKANHASQPK